MRGSRSVLLLAASITATVVACGGNDDKAETVPGASVSASAKVDAAKDLPTMEEVEGAVLALSDMPSWYTIDKSTDEDDTDEPVTAKDADCQKRFDEVDPDKGAADIKAKADYTAGEFGPMVSNAVAVFESESTTKEAVNEFKELFSDCPTWSTKDTEGATTKLTVSPLSMAKFGDETFALRVTAKVTGGVLRHHRSCRRRGGTDRERNHLNTGLSVSGFSGPVPQLEPLVDKTAKKLDAIV